LTQDLLHRPPIERKLSDEQSSNRLDTMLADGKQRLPSAPCFALPLPMPLVGFAVRFGSGTGETFPRADRVMAAQCPLGDWYLLSKRRSRWPGRSAGCRPVPSNRARQKARQPASPRPRTRSSNPVPSSKESANFQPLSGGRIGVRTSSRLRGACRGPLVDRGVPPDRDGGGNRPRDPVEEPRAGSERRGDGVATQCETCSRLRHPC